VDRGGNETIVRVRCTDVPPGEAIVVTVRDDLKLALFRLEDAYWAIDNRCPHRGGQLGAGGGYVYRGTTVVCPWHGYRVDVKTGGFLDHPQYRSRVFPVAVEGEEVVIRVRAEETGDAIVSREDGTA
jgi:nitrite reductase/ring-hydroxylating ferredoxin subunit